MKDLRSISHEIDLFKDIDSLKELIRNSEPEHSSLQNVFRSMNKESVFTEYLPENGKPFIVADLQKETEISYERNDVPTQGDIDTTKKKCVVQENVSSEVLIAREAARIRKQKSRKRLVPIDNVTKPKNDWENDDRKLRRAIQKRTKVNKCLINHWGCPRKPLYLGIFLQRKNV